MAGSNSPGGAAGQQATSALQPWSKAGIIIKASTRPGSAYAAMMVTGSHGVRMQWDYTRDAAGPGRRRLRGSAALAAADPLRRHHHRLRLRRRGALDQVGTATLPGLPATVQAGMFAASPASSQLISQSATGSSSSGGSTQATAVFDHVSLQGTTGGRWRGTDVGGGLDAADQPPGGGYRQSGGALTVTGSGDIAPDVPGGAGGTAGSVAGTLVGTFAGLIAVLVVGTMFITAEFRRGLIRVTLAASPRRSQVLAAKAIVLGARHLRRRAGPPPTSRCSPVSGSCTPAAYPPTRCRRSPRCA